MPDAADFLAGFGLIKGARIDGYVLESAHSTHITISRYQEYRYDITLVFQNLGHGTYDELYNTLIPFISGERIIYGIRNPYRCVINPPQYGDISQDSEGHMTFQLTGHSYRQYKDK